MKECKKDHRPPKGGWADGWYMCHCCHCQESYIGDKRSVVCADCAYETSTEKQRKRQEKEKK